MLLETSLAVAKVCQMLLLVGVMQVFMAMELRAQLVEFVVPVLLLFFLALVEEILTLQVAGVMLATLEMEFSVKDAGYATPMRGLSECAQLVGTRMPPPVSAMQGSTEMVFCALPVRGVIFMQQQPTHVSLGHLLIL